jgi:hypothetical protein
MITDMRKTEFNNRFRLYIAFSLILSTNHDLSRETTFVSQKSGENDDLKSHNSIKILEKYLIYLVSFDKNVKLKTRIAFCTKKFTKTLQVRSVLFFLRRLINARLLHSNSLGETREKHAWAGDGVQSETPRTYWSLGTRLIQ